MEWNRGGLQLHAINHNYHTSVKHHLGGLLCDFPQRAGEVIAVTGASLNRKPFISFKLSYYYLRRDDNNKEKQMRANNARAGHRCTL